MHEGWTSIPDRLYHCTNINTAAKLVMWTLYRMRDKSTNVCYPTIRQISKQWGLSTKTVSKALKDLEQGGFISIKPSRRMRSNPKHRPNHVYTIQPSHSWALILDSSNAGNDEF